MTDHAGSPTASTAGAAAGAVLLTLASGQFLMTLDTSVMNVSIAEVAEDVGTTVSGIQTAITLYALVIVVFWVYYAAMIFILGREVGQVYELRRVRRLQRETFED